MITMSFDGTDVRVISTLQAVGPNILSALVRKIEMIDLGLQQYIVTRKLQGQVLHHRSGKLAQSIRIIPVRQEGTRIVGGVQGGGGVAWYGRVHEFGGSGPYMIVPREKKVLRFEIGGTVIFARRVNHPPALERSFMRSSMEERRAWIVQGLRDAMIEGLRTSG